MDLTNTQVTWRNYKKLGYERLTHGTYGPPPGLEGKTEWDARQSRFRARTKAVMSVYREREIALYGPTALQVLSVELPAALQDWTRCHVIVPRGTSRPNRRDVVAHNATANLEIWGTRDGLPLLHPVDHWLQLRGTDDELIEVADGLVRRKRPLIGMDDFHRRLGELAGATGVQKGRQLMRFVMAGTDSLYETRTRLVLVRAGLPTPAVNYPVPCRSGFTYHVDMGYVREKVAVEYDGAVHVSDTRQQAIDAERRRDLQDEGWIVINVTGKQLASPVQLVRSVEAALIMRRAAFE
ncbi:MAG: DUF559 domain-containing protein [Propionibacteriaceae bacterium]|nr:DUF559 domain-containing protein [Propionibacteriaceae bacterium]